MNYSDKIKALQQKAGVKADGIASSKTWLGIYNLLFASLPYDINVNALIKKVQQKINVRANGEPSPKTWDVLYQILVGEEEEIMATEETPAIDLHNEIILSNMTKEVVPFAKELIQLAAAQEIHIKLMNGLQDDVKQAKKGNAQQIYADNQINFSNYNFGLAFDVGIFDSTETGELIYKDNSPLYAKVAKLGESIGLTWAGSRKTFTSLPHFQLRPAWAVRMKESEMIKELCRRKEGNLNLLAFL